MKGLLLKEWYSLWGYLRFFPLMGIFFLVLGTIAGETGFLLYYPCVFASLMSVSLLSYEERDKWEPYGACLPVKRSWMVSAKYLLSLLLTLGTILATLLVQTLGQLLRDQWDPHWMPGFLVLALPAGLLPIGLLLPFLYKLGTEKGRLAYYGVVGLVCAALLMITNQNLSGPRLDAATEAFSGPLLWIMPLVSLGVYGLSWALSVRLYEKRTF